MIPMNLIIIKIWDKEYSNIDLQVIMREHQMQWKQNLAAKLGLITTRMSASSIL